MASDETHNNDEVGEELAQASTRTASLLDEILPDRGVRLQTSSRDISGESLHHPLEEQQRNERPLPCWKLTRWLVIFFEFRRLQSYYGMTSDRNFTEVKQSAPCSSLSGGSSYWMDAAYCSVVGDQQQH